MFPDMPTSKPLVSGYVLVFGAMYLVSDDIATAILVHAAIDIASRIFASHPTMSSTPAIVAFIFLLAARRPTPFG